MRNVDIKTYVYLEGIRVNVKRISISSTENNPTVCTIELPANDKIKDIHKGTKVAIFYYDPFTHVGRLLFDGEISGQNYQKNGSQNYRGLHAIDNRIYLNSMPSKYVNLFIDSAIENLSARSEFYGVPLAEAMKKRTAGMLKFANLYTGKEKSKIKTYFNNLFNLLYSNWEYYYSNVNTINGLIYNHYVTDNSVFEKRIKADAINSYVSRMVSVIGRENNGTLLDQSIEYIKKVGYKYIGIPSAAMKKDNNPKFKSPREYSMAQFGIINELDGAMPPMCNVIKADRSDSLTINIYQPEVTRLRHEFLTTYNKLTQTSYEYPFSTIGKTRKMSDLEKEIGIFPLIENRTWMYEYLVGSSLQQQMNGTKDKDVSEYLAYSVEKRFYDIAFRKNTLFLSTIDFNPYIVVGLPSIVWDEKNKDKYYGIVKSHSIDINFHVGQITTQVSLRNIEEVKTDTTTKKISISRVDPKTIGIDANSCYSELLKGLKFDEVNQKKFMYVAKNVYTTYDESSTNINISDASTLLELRNKTDYSNGYKSLPLNYDYSRLVDSDKDTRREIITWGEYWYLKGLGEINDDNFNKSKYSGWTFAGGNKLNEGESIPYKETTIDQVSTKKLKIEDKPIFIKTRREAVNNYVKSI